MRAGDRMDADVMRVADIARRIRARLDEGGSRHKLAANVPPAGGGASGPAAPVQIERREAA